ncbi:hypothetical protein ACQ7DA_09555 [Zafaria sp. J156]|uniref:hypothetical protein n=1 Tax=Zafaria sp. J156 TaxID=3116490 RepID=UPI002E774696|nr:hypothetical protein [Zafaria sp. J156]MEE1621928.1 hypothetical protein [Zafaria sp. J156]
MGGTTPDAAPRSHVQAISGDAPTSRAAVAALDGAGVLSPEDLARAGDDADERSVVVRHVLRRHGFDPGAAGAAAAVLAQVAGAVQERHGGLVQRMLRAHAEQMRQELLGMVADPRGLEEPLRQAFAHWLQNAADLPISLVDAPVRAFLDARGIGVEQLEGAADAVDLNIALVDDVLRAEVEEQNAEGGGAPGAGGAEGPGEEP